MPARQRGWTRKRKRGWQACWRENGRIRTQSGFPSKTAAEDWLDEHLENGAPRRGRDITFAEHVERYLRVHSAAVQPGTIRTLRERLGTAPTIDAHGHRRGGGEHLKRRQRDHQTPLEAFGDLRLADLEHMSAEIADWIATLPASYRYAIVSATRQVLEAAVRWRLIRENPAKRAGPNPQPRREEVAFFESLADIDALAVELGPRYGPLVVFGVETGLMPSEWRALERRHIDRRAGIVKVRRWLVDGALKEFGKVERRRRDVPLTARALEAIDRLPARLETPLLFPGPTGRPIDLHNWRRRDWRPAIEAAGLDPRLTPYSMRHTFASYALDAGVSIFELARLMGTSVHVIDLTYGHLVHGAHDRVRAQLERRAKLEREREDADAASEGGQ